MRKLLTILIIGIFPVSLFGGSSADRQTNEFTTINGLRAVRSVTPGEGFPQLTSQNRQPIRNPHIMADVRWVDRNSENAIAEDVSTTPDGSGIFIGWWLNNMRFSAYASAGTEFPVWRYNQNTPWTMPVAASDARFAGTGSGFPSYVWDKDSPLFTDEIDLGPNYNGGGVAFSGDGSLVASAFALGTTDAILVLYDMVSHDTLFTRTFDQARGLQGVDLSRDGTVAVVTCYDWVYVFDVPSGTPRDTIYNYSQVTAKTSADGSLITLGFYTGRVYLYHWNGNQYRQQWIVNTFHDWVTAVDISDDGSTVACGTMDFVGNQVAGGKFEMLDAATGDTLITYYNYGDMVSSVALSADGRYAIAGCWGTFQQTFGDVVTCFYRESSVPIFELLDDIDEPGSIFGVAISDSGHYAAAGGKAVHAREFGYGGMLYSIQVRDPLTNDVAVSSIDQPGEFLAPGESVTPTATYINVGNSIASFTAACAVTNLDNNEVVYNSSVYLSDVMPFFTSQAPFSPDFVMPSEGRFRMTFSAIMDGDEDTSNNTLSLVIRSWHDMQAVSISSPFDEATVNWPMTPIASFKNLGSYTEDCDIILSIRDSTDTEVYSAIATIYGIAPYMVEQIQFDPWAPDQKGLYTISFDAQVTDDHTPANNIISKSFRVVQEMLYDDGMSEMSIWVDAYPSSTNRKFAERFQPNLPAPFWLSNMRFYIANAPYTGSLDYVGICGEMDGFPDTTNFYQVIQYPELPGPDNWASFNLDYLLTDDNPLWIVLHWADGDTNATGPYIGADNTQPIDQQSYWYRDNDIWHLWQVSDWMFRMTVSDQQNGVGSDIISGLPTQISLKQNYPNPFNPDTKIEFGLPNAGNVRIEIFNALGQQVKCLVDSYMDAGYHSVIWDGKTRSGFEAASGLYYYRLTSGDYRISKRMTLLK